MDCGKCFKSVYDNEAIKCTCCLTVLHFLYADLTEVEFKKILPMNRKKWKCLSCECKKQGVPASSSLPISPKTNLAASLNIDTEALTKHMDTKLSDLRQQWRENLNMAISDATLALKKDMNALEARMCSWEDRLSQVEVQTANCASVPTNLLEENVALRANLETLSNKLGDIDQAARCSNVEIQNIPEKKGENLVQICMMISKMLNVELNDGDIKHVHRIAPGTVTERPKNIILHLTTRRQRDNLIATARARRSLSTDQLFGTSEKSSASSNGRFFVNEHLTLKNKILFSKARQLANERGYRFVWVKSGCIFVRKCEQSKVIQLRSEKDFSKIA